MQEDFTHIQELLRLKRYEVPPPEYFEDFLCEFHHRQRAELLRRPLWRIALDRLECFLPSFHQPSLAYASGFAVVLAALGIFSGGALYPRLAASNSSPSRVPTMAVVSSGSEHSGFAPVHEVSPSVRLTFDGNQNAIRLLPARLETAGSRASATGGQPRYVVDVQAVRYEPQPASF